MRTIDDKVLLVETRDPDAITASVKKSTVMEMHRGTAKVAVHWGLKEAQALVALGHDAPSPLLRDYQWTGKFSPFEHQKTTASVLSLRKRAFCFSEAGTGKTASVIWSVDYLMQLGKVKRVLVLCPLSIMKAAWQQDLF